MKNVLFILSLLISTTILAQEEWGDLQKNKLTMKEIAPIWPGCESKDVQERDACFNRKLTQHVMKNFKYPPEEYKKNIQGEVIVDFIINTKGIVEVKKVVGGNKGLQAEAKRNIMSIPKLTPGMLGGEPRAIEYSIPFNFKTGK